MERDFMGLGSIDSNVAVKEEAVEECKELDFLTFSKASSSNKASIPPHFMAFKPRAEEKTVKTVPSAELQKVHNGPRGSPFALPTYSDAKMFPLLNQAISAPMRNSIFNSNFGGSQVLRPHPIHPPLGSAAGTTETRFGIDDDKFFGIRHQNKFNLKPSEIPQLTIFYGGTVNVFDNISPDKAQAILFLAGNVSAKVAKPRPQTQLANTTPNSDLSSPISISSHPIVQSGKDSRSKDEVMPIKPLTVLSTPNMPASSNVTHSAVPQARKASLARFLEKRKERVSSSAPYNIGKISPECATSGSNNR